MRLLVSIGFLGKLLEWQPLLAGVVGFLLTLPLNIWSSKRSTVAQAQLMNTRDRKLMMLTEALQGIRQIKFSAQEDQWQARIGIIRQAELSMQWLILCYETALICCWVLGPVILSAIALAVYATLHGELSASVAFTSITIFSLLEFSLAVLPQFVAMGTETWVSLRRIENYLRSPEKEDYVTADTQICFDKATLSWPLDGAQYNSHRFKLEDISLQIPEKKFTVVSGPTGSGKSLFLTSLIGEADLLSGRVRAPKPPSIKDRFDHIAHKGDWIIESAMAFVAQISWIENATIQENILFGLPYQADRYEKVIDHCALKQDLDNLPDGDMTELGLDGINLSGGQKWRIAFARALYSRAGILVLDDLFR